MATRVVLRRWPASEGGGIIALMPDVDEGRGLIGSYEHVGQHGAASRDVVDRTWPVDPADADAQALVRELTGLGYHVRIVRRVR
jgi:hypothetical protein